MRRKNATSRKPEILEAYYQIIIEEGLEGASLGKVAARLDIHPSLIIHYFKNKENLNLALVDLLIEKYEAPDFLQFDHLTDPKERFQAFIDTIFSRDWSRTVDPGVHFGFYYLSFRHPKIRTRFRQMFLGFRNYLLEELEAYQNTGVINPSDLVGAADIIMTLMEGLEFHANFLEQGEPFEQFASQAKQTVIDLLKTAD